MNGPSPAYSTWNGVVATFRRHARHYVDHGGGENALVGLRAEGAVTLQYAGRVVYELFQNALDRAESRVLVRFDDGVLLVGNDGVGVTVDPDYDYSRPIEGEGRSDFHALCALHTSNKSAERQFGNKGIGFRSVFGVADAAEIWSRCADGGWWGMELRQRLVPVEWPGSALADIDEMIAASGRQPRPSFHFPRLLRRREHPAPGCDDISTIVLVPVTHADHQRQIDHEVERLKKTRFQFVGLRRTGIAFHLSGSTVASDAGWPMVSSPRHHRGYEELGQLARSADHPIAAPRVAVAWAATPATDDHDAAGLFYNHLPTRMLTGLPVDVHADFQVKADREGMAIEADNPVGAYNLALLLKAAEAHVEALRQESNKEHPRRDFWQFADRPRDATPAWTCALRDVLFPDGNLDCWVDLAAAFFRADADEGACRDFWNSSLRWLEELAGYGHWTKTWAAHARRFCDALSERSVPVIPVVAEGGARAVPVPSRQERGHRASRRVFYWSPRGDGDIPPVPDVLLGMGRVVTSFPLGAFEAPAGVQPFAEAELLPELRQVPNDPTSLSVTDTLSENEQGGLLLFASRLASSRRVPHFAWRAFAESDDAERIGRALSTMFLPTVDGRWEPARQLSADRVDRERLATLLGASTDLGPFLALLGVAPSGAVPLVEGGEKGRVPPLPLPPTPQEAVRGQKIAALEPIIPPGTAPGSMLASTSGLPPDGPRSRVHEMVRTTAWLDSRQFRAFEGIPPLPAYVAPLDVVLHLHDPQRVFFAVPQEQTDQDVIRELGALNRPDDEGCIGRVPNVLAGLRGRIPAPGTLPASVALSLAALYNRLMPRLEEGDKDVPILVESAGRLAWLDEGDEAWLARREERQQLRRFFPDVTLVAAEHRDGLSEFLRVGQVRLRKRVRPNIDEVEETTRAAQIKQRIGPHLPVLAAVADQSRQAARTLSPGRLLRAWHLQRPIVEVADAWVELRLEGPQREPIAWRKGEFDDVFHLPAAVDGDPGVVIFDADPRIKDRPDWSIPLRYFGDALAVLFVNNAILGPLFAQVLASIDEDRLGDFVERNHLEGLVKEWTEKLRPLKDSERDVLLERLDGACIDGASVLRSGRIAATDLRRDGPATRASELHDWLRADIPDFLAAYLPAVMVAHDNQLAWRKWYERRRVPLAALVEALRGLPSTWKSDIQALAGNSWDLLWFSAPGLVATYLAAHGHVIEDVDVRLDEISPAFQTVKAAPISSVVAGWRAGRGSSAAGHGGPHRRVTAEELIEESFARGAIGDAAEKALLSWVVEEAALLRGQDGFEDALLSVFSKGTKTWREVKAALKRGDLHDALHVADRWSGAGFDVLGLESVDGSLVPVRYECKGIAAASPRVRVYLSRNELGVARRVHREGPGRWVLVGVQPDGRCVDLTSLIGDLLDAAEVPLEPLHARGIEPDGIRLVVERAVQVDSA